MCKIDGKKTIVNCHIAHNVTVRAHGKSLEPEGEPEPTGKGASRVKGPHHAMKRLYIW